MKRTNFTVLYMSYTVIMMILKMLQDHLQCFHLLLRKNVIATHVKQGYYFTK